MNRDKTSWMGFETGRIPQILRTAQKIDTLLVIPL